MGRDRGWEVEGEHTHMSRAGFGACSYLLHQDRLTLTGKFVKSGVISGFITVFNIKGFGGLLRLTQPWTCENRAREGRQGRKGRLEEQPRTNRKPWEGNDSQRRERGAFSLLLTTLPLTEKRVSISFAFKAFLQQDKASQIPLAREHHLFQRPHRPSDLAGHFDFLWVIFTLNVMFDIYYYW